MVSTSHAELADALLHSLQFPQRVPDLSWKDNLTGDAWTAITLHVESCDATGQTSGRSVHHTLVEPARYQGADAANFQALLACLLEMANARDTAFWQVVSGRRSTPPPPRVAKR